MPLRLIKESQNAILVDIIFSAKLLLLLAKSELRLRNTRPFSSLL